MIEQLTNYLENNANMNFMNQGVKDILDGKITVKALSVIASISLALGLMLCIPGAGFVVAGGTIIGSTLLAVGAAFTAAGTAAAGLTVFRGFNNDEIE